MKVIKHVGPACDCQAQLARFAAVVGVQLCPGSIIECNCGRQYILVDDQRDGLGWQLHAEPVDTTELAAG